MMDFTSSDDPEVVRLAVEAAQQHYQAGRLTQAAAILQPLVAKPDGDGLPKPVQAKPLELYGQVLHDLARPIEAADAIEKASLVAPIGDPARIALASCYAELRRDDLARELYLQLALSRRLPAELMLQVAAGLAAIDSPQLAMQVCEWVIEINDSFPQAYYDMGSYSIRCGQPLYMAEALTRRALQLDPANIHYRFGLVALIIQLNRDDEALQALGDLTPQKVEQVTCASCLGRVAGMLDRLGKRELATVCQQRADQLNARQATEFRGIKEGNQP
jgi:tetratricopeptide (TPR) repeat protein